MEKERVISVCSLKGGVGRSLASVSLAAAYARRGLSVLLVDLDPFAHTLDLLLGLENQRLFGLSDILAGRDPRATLLRCEQIPNLLLCPGSDQAYLPDKEQLSRLISLIEKEVSLDRIILDLPVKAEQFGFFLELSAKHLVVSTQDPPSLLLASATADLLKSKEQGTWLLLNRFDLSDPSTYQEGRMRACEMIDEAGLPLIGIVPEQYDLVRRYQQGELWHHEEQIDRPFDNVVSRLEGEERLLFEGMKDGKRLRRSL